MERSVYCTIKLDHGGEVTEVLDENGEPRRIVATGEGICARVGERAPGGRIITAVSTIEIVSVDTGDGADDDHSDPCYVRDSRGNWICVCRRPPCP